MVYLKQDNWKQWFSFKTIFLKTKHILQSKLFYVGLFLKLSFACFLGSDILVKDIIPFINQVYQFPFENPYATRSLQSDAGLFPYPAGMVGILAFFKMILTPIIGQLPLINSDLLLFRIPLLCADFIILYVMTKMSVRYTKKVILYYWLNPVLIYITYIHGQIDVIPVAFLVVAGYMLYRQKVKSSALLVGLGCTMKLPVLLAIPLCIMTIPRSEKQMVQRLLFGGIACMVIASTNGLYMIPEYAQMVYQGTAQLSVLDSSISFAGQTLFYIIPALFIGIYMRYMTLKSKGRDVFFAFLTFSYGVLLVCIPPTPGWYYWIIPFLVITCVHNHRRTGILIHSLSAAYFFYFLCAYDSDFTTVFQVICTEWGALNPFIMYVSAFSKEVAVILNSLSFTILQTSLLIICVWIYYFLSQQLSLHKITSAPFLIGISGDSSSGKTRLSQLIQSVFGGEEADQCLAICGDDLHRWERGNKQWDEKTHLNPKSNKLYSEVNSIKKLMNGHAIKRQHYCHESGTFMVPKTVYPKHIMMFEGLHTYYLNSLQHYFDLKFFMKPDETLREYWKIERDVNQRKKSKDDVVASIKKRKKDSGYILQQEEASDVIITYLPKTSLTKRKNNDLEILCKVKVDNAINLEEMLVYFDHISSITYHHEFLPNKFQQVSFSGYINFDEFSFITNYYEEELYHLGLFVPKWKDGFEGIMQLLLVTIILDKVKR